MEEVPNLRPRRVPMQLAVLFGLMGAVALLCWFVVSAVARTAIDVEVARWSALMIFALAVNCALTGSIWFADFFAGFSLPSGYYNLRKFERNGRLYERLGVRIAGQIFSHSPAVRFSGRREQLPSLESDMRLAETHHLLSLIVIVPVAVLVGIIGEPRLTFSLLTAALALQAYPIILQRYNRGRLLRLAQMYGR